MEIDKEHQRLKKKPQLFIKNIQDIIAEAVDTKVQITNEEIDVSVTVQNLMQLMQIAPEYKEGAVKQVFDLLGLDVPKQNPVPQEQPGQPPMSQPMPGMNMQNIMQQANIPNGHRN